MEIVDRKEDLEQQIDKSQEIQSVPQNLTLCEVNLQLYQEYLWYQIGQNIPNININRHSALNDKKLSGKEAPPSYYFQQVFTLDNSVLVCKVIDRRLLLSKKNIYHKNRVRHHHSSTSFASFEKYNITHSDYESNDYDMALQFPTRLIRDLICVEFEKGNPMLLVPSSIGMVYILKLKDLHLLIGREEHQVPTLDLEIGSSFIHQLVRTTEKGPLMEREGLNLAANCNNAVVHLFNIPQLFAETYRRISSSYEIKLGKSIFDNLLGSILTKHNEKDSLVTLQYISHKILVGVTRNNVMKVINLHKRGVIFEYKLTPSDDMNERVEDSSEPCLRVLSSNPLVQNDKINFLIVFAKLNSNVHRYVKLFNLSFHTTHNKRKIHRLSEVPTSVDLGSNCDFSLLATYDTTSLITSIDLNYYGLAVSSYEEAECNCEIHHIRFAQGKAELSNSLFSEVTQVLSFDDRRSNLISSSIAPEDICDILHSNHELIPIDAIVQALKDLNLNLNQSILGLKPLEKRAALIDVLRASWESGAIGDIGILKLFQECFLKSKESTKVEGVFLSKDQDFSPIILRNKVVSIAIKGDKIESLDMMNKINIKKEMGYEIFNSVDLDNPEYFENFLLLLSFFKKHTGSYAEILQDYLEKDYDNIPTIIDNILAEIESEFKYEERERFFSLLEDLTACGSKISNWCEQLVSLFQKALDANGDDINSNVHLIDNIDVWGFSTIELVCGVARQRIRHYLDICLDFTLMVKFINNNHSVPDFQRVSDWELRPLFDYIQSMMSFIVLMGYTPKLKHLSKSEYKDISDVIYNLNNIDTFTYFVVFEYKKYLGNASSYHLMEPQEWINKVCAKLIRKISFEPRYERVDEIPEIVSFLLKLKEYDTTLTVIDKMFYKNPALEYAKTESLYRLDRIGDMMASLYYVASYVNLESFRNQGKPSIYNNYWHDKGKDYLKSVTERITTSLSSALSSFLLNAMKYSFCTSQNISAGIASTALYLQDVDQNSLEIVDLHQKNKDYEGLYNFLYLFPREQTEHKKEYMYIFRKIINDLILNNQFKKLIEFPLDSEGYQIVINYLEEYLKQECERMISDFETTLHKPEDIYVKFEKVYFLYHKVISFFLEKELYKQAGYIMISFYESLSTLDNAFKNLKKAEYLKVLKSRLGLLNEAIYSLDVSEDQYGYVMQKNKDNKTKVKRNYIAMSNNRIPKVENSVWTFSRKKENEMGDLATYVEDFLDNELVEEEFITLTKEKLMKHKELLSARILLEDKETLTLPESDYLLPENIARIGKHLVALSEFEKAVDFSLAFRFTIQDVVHFMINLYFFHLEAVFSEAKLYECLRRILTQVESYKGVFVRDVIAEALLKYSEEKYGYAISLPPFLIDDFREKDPVRLAQIYIDFELYQEAVNTLVLAIEKNRRLLNEREIGQITNIADRAHYIDPNVFQEVVGYLDNLAKTDKNLNLNASLERLFRAVERAFEI